VHMLRCCENPSFLLSFSLLFTSIYKILQNLQEKKDGFIASCIVGVKQASED